MEAILEAYMEAIWTGDSSWLALASLRALVVAFAALAVLRTSNYPAGRPFVFLGSLGILGAFAMRFAHAVVTETHPYLTYDSLAVNTAVLIFLIGVLRITGRKTTNAVETRRLRNYGSLNNFQRRMALVLGILIMAFTVNLEGVQWFFGFLGLGLMLLYLLPGEKPEEDKNV